MKSKINDRERLEMKKYCSHDRKHTNHKETR
jgi:large subunit ribosomal protein L33